MPVLTASVLKGHGPFIHFSEGDRPNAGATSDTQPTDHQVAERFFSFADSLLETYCGITNAYSPFDPHFDTELARPHEIRLLAREFFLWAAQIVSCRLDHSDLAVLIDLYLPAEPVDGPRYEQAKEQLRTDLVETATFLGQRLNSIAQRQKVLWITGL